MVGLNACAANPPPLPATAASAGDAAYLLGPGDRLRITVYNEINLTGEYAITGSGDVAFPLVGTVPATDRTIEQLQELLTQRLAAGFVNDPKVSVEVMNYRPYFILGEVARPGQYPYAVGMTIEQAVAAAGGYTYRANIKVAFLRRARMPEEHSVDLRGPAVRVLPGDTIRLGERYF